MGNVYYVLFSGQTPPHVQNDIHITLAVRENASLWTRAEWRSIQMRAALLVWDSGSLAVTVLITGVTSRAGGACITGFFPPTALSSGLLGHSVRASGPCLPSPTQMRVCTPGCAQPGQKRPRSPRGVCAPSSCEALWVHHLCRT